MKVDTWMPLYVTDYLGDTMHLTTEQHGAYLLLLMACWKRGGSLPNDDAHLAGVSRMTLSAWRKSAATLRAFFRAQGDVLVHKRVTEEMDKAQRMADARRENGRLGGRPKKPSETGDKPRGFSQPPLAETPARVALPSPETSPNGDISPNPLSGALPHADAFAEVCKAYPADGLGSPDKRGEAWRELMDAGADPADVVHGVRAFASTSAAIPSNGRTLAMHRFLRERRWENYRQSRSSAPTAAWAGPASLRAAVVRLMGEAWTAGWVDRWTRFQDVPERLLVAATPLARDRIEREIGAVLREHGVSLALAEEAA